jgi:hypothetical protein
VIAIVGDIDPTSTASGLSTRLRLVGRAAVAAGAKVEVVGVVDDGANADQALVALARERLGHAAVMRSPAGSLDTADLALALRYLPDLRVVVLLGVPDPLLPAAIEGAAFSGAKVLVVTDGDAVPTGLPGDAVVMQAPPNDSAGTFAGFVGQLAARLDGGASAADAWTATMATLGIEPGSDWRPGALDAAGES